MRESIRPLFSAGVALVGAGAIVAAPISPTPPDEQIPDVRHAAVAPTALLDDFELEPPLGALVSQFIANQFGNAAAIPPALIGQVDPTRYGAVGLIAGAVDSPLAFAAELASSGSITQAIGAGAGELTHPLANTFYALAGLDGYTGAELFSRTFRAYLASGAVINAAWFGLNTFGVYNPMLVSYGAIAGANAVTSALAGGASLQDAIGAGLDVVEGSLTGLPGELPYPFQYGGALTADVAWALVNRQLLYQALLIGPQPTMPLSQPQALAVPGDDIDLRAVLEMLYQQATGGIPPGLIAYQVLANQLDDIAAIAPVLTGSVGAESYGFFGTLAGIVASPLAFTEALGATGSLTQAVGAAANAVTQPIYNTLDQLLLDPAGADWYQRYFLTGAALYSATLLPFTFPAADAIAGPFIVGAGLVDAGTAITDALVAGASMKDALEAGATTVAFAVVTALQTRASLIGTSRALTYNYLTSGPYEQAIPPGMDTLTASREAAADDEPALQSNEEISEVAIQASSEASIDTQDLGAPETPERVKALKEFRESLKAVPDKLGVGNGQLRDKVKAAVADAKESMADVREQAKQVRDKIRSDVKKAVNNLRPKKTESAE